MFMLLLLILSIFLLVTAVTIQNDVGTKCSIPSNNYVMVISAILMAGSVALFSCDFRCDCNDAESTGLMLWAGFSFVMGIALIVLGAKISNAVTELGNEACKNGSLHADRVWGVGIVLLLLSLLYFGFILYNKYNFVKELAGRPRESLSDSELRLVKKYESAKGVKASVAKSAKDVQAKLMGTR